MIHSMRFGRRLCVVAVLLASTQMAFAQDAFDAPAMFTGKVGVSGADRSPIYPGTTATVSGEGFAAGQTVTVERGDTVLVDAIKADGEGKFTATFDVPADAVIGVHPVIVKTDAPDSAEVIQVKVSPNLETFGEDKFDIVKSASLAGNLYQVAISEKTARFLRPLPWGALR
jgi:hypothetical protein